MTSHGLKDTLIGTWTLVSWKEIPSDGSAHRLPFGERPEGILIYTRDGHMSAQLMCPGRRVVVSTPREYAEETVGYLAYAGPFEVDDSAMAVTHSVRVSLFPGWVGQTERRTVRLEGDHLELSTAEPRLSGGASVAAHLMWKRVASSARTPMNH